MVNEVPTYRIDPMPYGGVKDSGLGREGVRYAIEEMTELKLLAIKTGSTRQHQKKCGLLPESEFLETSPFIAHFKW